MLEEHDSILLAYAWVVNDDDNKLSGDDLPGGHIVDVVVRSSRRFCSREADAPATVTDP